jgi:hypothetical protein
MVEAESEERMKAIAHRIASAIQSERGCILQA